MKKVILVLVVLANLVFAAKEWTQADIEYADKECESGDLRYCIAIGEYYYLFGGAKVDYKKARYYFEKVCKPDKSVQKNEAFVESCGNLANMYSEGIGVTKNYKKAFKLYEIVCNAGSAIACSSIGLMYQNGEGIKKDVTKGLTYLKKSCDVGYWRGCANFAIYHYGQGNNSKAVLYYKKAYELGKDDYTTQNHPESRVAWELVCSMCDFFR